jgi:hypothetical protein
MADATGSTADGLVGLVNVFVDPQTTARKVPSPYSWVWPVLILVIGYTVTTYLTMPFTLQMMEAGIRQRNLPPEQLDQALTMERAFGQAFAYLIPFFGIAFIALFALLVKVVYSLMDIRPTFRDLFTMLADCSVIPFLQVVATYVVLRVKADPVETAEQMQPPFGLDIFLQGIHGVPFAFVHFFSIFQIWFLVVLVFGLASLTKSSKIQALIAITPVWIVPLALVMVGAMFQKS